MKNIFARSILAVVIYSFFFGIAYPADYPRKPIQLINPMSPGGSRDIMARAFASVAEKILGQPILVLNKTGGGGMLGMLEVAKAAPDGYSIVVTSSGDTCAVEWELVNGRQPPFSLKNSFAHIGTIAITPQLIVVKYENPWKTLPDLVRDCKAKPGYYSVACGGMYGIAHMAIETFIRAAGIQVRNVPFKGGAGATLPALLGGHVDFIPLLPPTAVPLVEGKKARALAVMDRERFHSLPAVPTLKELGMNAISIQRVGFLAPQKTPTPILEKLRETLRKVSEDKSFKDALAKIGEKPEYRNAAESARAADLESQEIRQLMTEIYKEENPKSK